MYSWAGNQSYVSYYNSPKNNNNIDNSVLALNGSLMGHWLHFFISKSLARLVTDDNKY